MEGKTNKKNPTHMTVTNLNLNLKQTSKQKTTKQPTPPTQTKTQHHMVTQKFSAVS